MEFGQQKFFVQLIHFISQVFLAWTFLNFQDRCASRVYSNKKIASTGSKFTTTNYFILFFSLFTADLLPHFSDNEIKVKNLQRTTLTGNSKLSDLTKSFKDLNNWMFQPMRLATFKLNFSD